MLISEYQASEFCHLVHTVVAYMTSVTSRLGVWRANRLCGNSRSFLGLIGRNRTDRPVFQPQTQTYLPVGAAGFSFIHEQSPDVLPLLPTPFSIASCRLLSSGLLLAPTQHVFEFPAVTVLAKPLLFTWCSMPHLRTCLLAARLFDAFSQVSRCRTIFPLL